MVRAGAANFDQIGMPGEQHPWLFYRIGFLWPFRESPANAQGFLRQHTEGTRRWDKLYLPPKDIRLGPAGEELDWHTSYAVPPMALTATREELVLAQCPGWDVTFGRFGEEKSFGFNPENKNPCVYLQRFMPFTREFKPVYFRVTDTATGLFLGYYAFDLNWTNDNNIRVDVLPVKKEDVPEFLLLA
jgi:hypothetical protein